MLCLAGRSKFWGSGVQREPHGGDCCRQPAESIRWNEPLFITGDLMEGLFARRATVLCDAAPRTVRLLTHPKVSGSRMIGAGYGAGARTIPQMGSPAGAITVTRRLVLRRFSTDDAAFVLELLNDPDFLHHIGDKGVRSLTAAEAYIANGPQASYRRHGHGLYCVQTRGERAPVGMCGFLRREGLDGPDLGYAFLPPARGRGLAFEAASAALDYGRQVLGFDRVLAITAPANIASIRLLNKLSFRSRGVVALPGIEGESELFEWRTRQAEALDVLP